MSEFERDDTNRADDFYCRFHAHGVIYIARRGLTALKAADFDADGTIFPILYEQSKLERQIDDGTLTHVPRADVPKRVENYLEGQYYATAVQLGMADRTSEGKA